MTYHEAENSDQSINEYVRLFWCEMNGH